MGIHMGVVMDPIHQIHFKKDTTLSLLMAAKSRGWKLSYIEPKDLFWRDNQTWAIQRALDVFWDESRFFSVSEPHPLPLGELDVILMRQDPPFNMNYIYATYLLELAEKEGVKVVNRPRSIRDCNEKLYLTQFPSCIAPTMVSSDASLIKSFVNEHGDIIIKPLDGMGGSGVFRHREGDPNLGAILETLTQLFSVPVMCQRYIPEIAQGDKRIVMVGGEAIPYCLARIPQMGETRANLAAGGVGRPQPLSERDWVIAQAVGPDLKERGLDFVGLDVIGDYLTEINVTSPTGIRQIDAAYNTNIADRLMSTIEDKLK